MNYGEITMAKKKESTEQPAAPARTSRVRLPRSLRKHIRKLKSEGRLDEANAQHKAATDAKQKVVDAQG
jgi:hypothetical protein